MKSTEEMKTLVRSLFATQNLAVLATHNSGQPYASLIAFAGKDDLKEIQNATKQAIPTDLNSDLNQWKEDVSSWTTPPTIGKTAEDTETSSEDPADPDDDTIEEEQS